METRYGILGLVAIVAIVVVFGTLTFLLVG
jgi:hypothetical protein